MSGKGERVQTEPAPEKKKTKIEQSKINIDMGERTREVANRAEESPESSFPSLSLN
jgi:hypothetical protein